MTSPGDAGDWVFRFGEFELHAAGLELRRAGTLIDADGLVLKLLRCLVRSAGQLVTKDQLVDEVWERRAVADNAITVAIARLRKTLGQDRGTREFVATVYGRGYRFVAEVALERAVRPAPAALLVPTQAPLPFVGRDVLLGRLHRALADARAGYGRAALLMGEPGIGKTAVVEAFERDVSGPQLHVAWGYCREGGDTPPLAPWLRVLREVIATCPSAELERAVGSAARDVLRLLDDLQPQRAAQKEVLDARGPGRHRGFEAVVRTLAYAAQQLPRVIVLEDLHRADAGSLELLNYLLDEISRTRILLLATLRPPASHASPQALLPRVLGHGNCERIQLERLPREEVAHYVAAVLDDPTGSLGEAVFEKSEGNPFFMVELSRQLRHSELPDPGSLAVDHVALELIRQRVSQLDSEARGVLSAAAVIGRSFELPLLQVITDGDAATLMASLDDALAAEVVVAAPDSATGFAFGHELLRSVLYDALPASRRRRWHVRIVQALETRVQAGEAVPPSELAYHAYAALPESDPRKTVDFCRAAAAAASASVYANPDVVRYLRQALEALSLVPNASARFRMNLLLWSSVHARGCAHNEYIGLLQRALALAREQSDGEILVQTAYMLNAHPGFTPLPGGRAAVELGLSLLTPEQLEARALGLATLACAAPECYDGPRARALIEEAETLARSSGSFMSLAAALLCRRYIYGGATSPEVQDELDGLARAHPQRLPVLPADMAIAHAVQALQSGSAAQLSAALERMRACAHELRHIELVWHSERWDVMARLNADPNAEMLAELERLQRRAARYAIMGHEAFCAFDRAVVGVELGRAPVLDDALRRVLAYDTADPPSVWAMKVRAWASLGAHSDARAALRAVSPQQLSQLPHDRDYFGTLGHLARAVVALHAIDYAQVLYGMLAREPERLCGHVAFYCEGSTQQLLGMLAQTLGKNAQAAVHFQAGLAHSDSAGLGLRAAET
ncbi:MAG TPA: AAA family ATPase, partial [Polyangiales bacterium]|nr:AAA family ATPase [Polyangiales bacterium]